MSRRITYHDVPDDSDEEENWFGNADPKSAETSKYIGNTAIPPDFNTYEFDYGPTPEQAIENVLSLPSSVSHGKVYESDLYIIIMD